MVLMPGFQSTRLVTEGALEPFFFLYTDDSIQGNPETCKQSSIMLNYEVKNTVGSINNALVSPREVFKSSILSNAASIIIFHNHPSGNVNPSKDDIKITETLRAAGSILDIPVLDHIIIGGRNRDTYSFLEQGVLRKDMLRVKKSSKRISP